MRPTRNSKTRGWLRLSIWSVGAALALTGCANSTAVQGGASGSSGGKAGGGASGIGASTGRAGGGAAGSSLGAGGNRAGAGGTAAGTGGNRAGSGGSGGSSVGQGSGTISGSVTGGGSFTKVASAIWIGKPDTGSPPTIIYVSDAPLDCATVSVTLWDKNLGNNQVLELGLNGTTAASYQVGTQADVSYLGGTVNPTADSGTVTVSAVNPSANIVGTFDVKFGSDSLMGAFDAAFCATGVEP